MNYSIIALCSILFAQTEPTVLPADNPDKWILSFIDVETTGLVPGYNEMIDIGVVLSDLDGGEIGRTFIRIMPNFPERTAPEVPGMNGFGVKKWEKYHALSTGEAVDSLVAFYQQHTKGRDVLMVAYNSQFDAAFLDHLFRSEQRSSRELHYYFVMDLPSMAWGMGLRDLWGSRLTKKFGIPDEPHTPDEHTGITGADVNFRIYNELLKYARAKH